MKTLINTAIETILCLGFLICITCNKDNKVSEKETEESLFVKRVIAGCYELKELATLGEQNVTSFDAKAKATAIKQRQDQIISEFSQYAMERNIHIPNRQSLRGTSFKFLKEKTGHEFDEAWNEEMTRRNRNMLHALEAFSNEAKGALSQVIQSSIVSLKTMDHIAEAP
jgi:predicted outer membrane protein